MGIVKTAVTKAVVGAIDDHFDANKHERAMELAEVKNEAEYRRIKSENSQRRVENAKSFAVFIGNHWRVILGTIIGLSTTIALINALNTESIWAILICCILGILFWNVVLFLGHRLVIKYLNSQNAGDEFSKDVEWIKNHWKILVIVCGVDFLAIIIIGLIG